MNSLNDVKRILAENGAKMLAQRGESNREFYCRNRLGTVWKLLQHMDISEEDLNSLNIIHVAGSKGKGSTCTLIESILRANGIKTGLFISPHVKEITERICIDGKPISDERFVEIFQKMWAGKAPSIFEEYQYSAYFPAVLCMALRAFIDDGVEVAVIEVGIGGEYDPTNVIPKPLICVITLLEMEHTITLGDDIESIAWHKSGIFKPNSKAFTIPQKEAAMAMLEARAIERKCDFKVVPSLSHYVEKWNRNIEIGLKGKFQSINASLAIEVCLAWMRKMGRIASDNIRYEALPDKTINAFISGLKKASMVGRMQIIERPGTTYYIDFAQTRASVQNAVDWFQECCAQKEEKTKRKLFRVLVLFMVKKPLPILLPILQKLPYDKVIFPLGRLANDDDVAINGSDINIYQEYSRNVAETWKIIDPDRKEESYKTFANINEAVAWIASGRDEKVYAKAVEHLDDNYIVEPLKTADHVQVFVPGSFGLLRGFLTLLSE